MNRLSVPTIAALLVATPTVAQSQGGAGTAAAQPNYASASNWLCLPARADICSKPLPTTALNPNGYGSTGLSPVARDAPVDCFYVYPTVSQDQGLNSDLVAGTGERSAVQSQFARFAGVCRTYAPLYRQLTMSAVAAAALGTDIARPSQFAYADVASAWRTYLARHNRGRRFVLIGHSQGSAMLQQLIKREIEGKPVARRMLRAILPGFNLLVPQGRRVGGTFASTPLCAAPAETGCAMSWVSFRERNVPPEGALFGISGVPGMSVGCTNPARPGSPGWERLDSYWNTRFALPVPGGPIMWSRTGSPPTPFLRSEGLVSARCINGGQRGYLAVRTNADPADSRTDRIGGEVGMLGFFLPGWGMHLADMAIAQGDLIRAVEELGTRN